MSGKCGTCGRGLGLHHEQHCHHWGQVLPSECPGLIEQALNEVLSRDNETLRARIAELEFERNEARREWVAVRRSERALHARALKAERENEQLREALGELVCWEGASRAEDAVGKGIWQEVLTKARTALAAAPSAGVTL